MKNNSMVLIIGAVLIILGVVYMKSNSKWTDKYDELFIKYANEDGLDWKMLKAIAMNESSLGKNKGYESIGGTTGLMQIMLSTASGFIDGLTKENLNEDENQVMAAAAYFAHLKERFKGDVKKMVISYNQGETHTAKGQDFTKDYYQKYLNHYQEIV